MDVQKKTEMIFAMRDKIESKSRSCARKRLLELFDEGSFIEIGAFVSQRPTEFGEETEDEGVITGYGTVNGLLVYAFAQEPSILSGSVSEMHGKKICNIVDLAVKSHAPLVSMIDSFGIRAGEGIDALNEYGEIISYLSQLKGICPHVCIVFGTCSGAMSFVASNADYTIMQNDGELFLSSPSVMGKAEKSAQGKSSFEKGLTSAVFEKEEECIDNAKLFLDLFTDDEEENDPDRTIEQINDILSFDGYDVKDIIRLLADGETIFFKDGYAGNVVCCLCRLNGRTTGICANQPAVDEGYLDSKGAKKLSSFISFCDSYDIPILTLIDSAGFKADADEDISECASLVNAYSNATVPMVSVVIHKAYGSAYVCMCPKSAGADLYYALTTAEIASLPPAAGGLLFADDLIARSDDPVKARQEAIDRYVEITASPIQAAKRGIVDEIIEPLNMRQLVIAAFEAIR